jgi:hypothetical protein
VLDRDALYYPYIHVREDNINWLKATLLCFPQLRRIVPHDFHLNDPAAIEPFKMVTGARGTPLLDEEYTDGPYYQRAKAAQDALLKVLQQNEELILERYSQKAAVSDFGPKWDSFEMHTGKLLAPLHDFLLSGGRNLGWYSRKTMSHNADTRWVALHPVLGEAIMSIIAIAIADAAGLDIVTSSRQMHHALAVQDMNEVLDLLLGRYSPTKKASVDEKVDELAEVIMTTFFDLDKLTAEQIAELQKDGKDLRAFKDSLAPYAEHLTDPEDPVEREKRLREKAREVVAAWEKHRQSLPAFAKDALVEAAGLSLPAMTVTATAAANPVIAVAGAGFAVLYVTYKGQKILRDYRKNIGSPLNFLTRIEETGASLVLPPAPSVLDAKMFEVPS